MRAAASKDALRRGGKLKTDTKAMNKLTVAASAAVADASTLAEAQALMTKGGGSGGS